MMGSVGDRMGFFARQRHWDDVPKHRAQRALVRRVAVPTRRRKVFILGNSAAEIYSSRAPLIKELVSQDFDVVCASQPADVRAECHLAALGARCVILPPTRPGLSPFRDARTFWSLFGVLRRERPDVVLSFGLKPNVFGALAARLAGVDRRIAMVDGLRFTYTGGREWKHRIARIGFDFLYSFPCALSDALIVQNRDDRAFFVKHFMQRSAHRIHVMPGVGVDLDAYRPVPLPEGPLTLVMVSRLSRDKGVYEFAEAARRIKAQQLDVRFLLVGDLEKGPRAVRRTDLERWVKDGRLEHFADEDDARPWIKQSHLLVQTSYREGLPRAVMEAMAMGRPCIVTDVPGCRDVVTHHRNGIIVGAQNPAAIVDAVTLVLLKRKLLDPWSRAAVEAAHANFDAGRQAAAMVTKLNALC